MVPGETKPAADSDRSVREADRASARPDVSVVVVSYNARGVLESCLESLRGARDGLEVEVFVVDNASRDGSAELVGERFPEAVLIANRENVGFGRANNQAFARATGRYLLVLNPDTVVPS